jgi:hypothetical protein
VSQYDKIMSLDKKLLCSMQFHYLLFASKPPIVLFRSEVEHNSDEASLSHHSL